MLEPCNLRLAWARKGWTMEKRRGDGAGKMTQLLTCLVYKHTTEFSFFADTYKVSHGGVYL